MPDTNTKEAIDARITHAWRELSKGGQVPSYNEVAERARVPGATDNAKRQRVGSALRAAGLARGGRWGEKAAEAEPKSVRKAAPRPAPAAAATVPAASPRHASTLEGLEQDRERAIATMTGAALQVSSLSLAIAALKGVVS